MLVERNTSIALFGYIKHKDCMGLSRENLITITCFRMLSNEYS